LKSFVLCVTLVLASTSAKASEQRIVTVGPWVTEAVFALGRGSVVVARDKASVVPAAASGLPSVGYHRQLAFEGLMSLRPTLVLASADAGPPHVLEQLRAAGVATVVLADASTLEQVSDFVMRVANAAGADLEQARTAAAEIQRGIERTRAKASAKADHPRVLALYARGHKCAA
jgi:iron complex transport system substrate-binding protein